MRKVGMSVFAVLALAGIVFQVQADDAKKVTIKSVMKLHKDGVPKKVIEGTATAEEKKALLDGYEAIQKLKPPKGEADSWKEKTGAVIKALKDGDTAALDKAVNCKACHSVHK